MSGMGKYTISRGVVSAVFGLLFYLAGAAWWLAALTAALTFGWFLWAPHSGRYSVHPELGAAPLRRDERARAINDKAARNAWVATMLVTMGLALYYGGTDQVEVPVGALTLLLLLGIIVYYASDFGLRRRT